MRRVALMPLHGPGSLPDGNLVNIAGRPLFCWSLAAALESGCFAEIYVITDTPTARELVEENFAGSVHVLDRTTESGSGSASTELVMQEFHEQISFDVLCLVQATSPFTRATHFRDAIQQFEREQLDSMVTVAPLKRFLWEADGTPLNYDPRRRPRRRDFAGTLAENGAFYLTRAETLKKEGCRLGGKTGVFTMPEETLLEINGPEDRDNVERLLLQQRLHTFFTAVTVAMLVLDVDGTLTDGGMYYSATGEIMKKFDTRDANGIHRLRDSGVIVAVITADDSPAVHTRMKKLQIEHYFPGVKDKLPRLQQLAGEWNLSMDRIACVGDDLGDRECLRQAGLSLCPADAVPAIRSVANYVCTRGGGRGAVREACDLILRINAGEFQQAP